MKVVKDGTEQREEFVFPNSVWILLFMSAILFNKELYIFFYGKLRKEAKRPALVLNASTNAENMIIF